MSSSRFLPNFSQVQEALKQLPDAQTYNGDSYDCRIVVDNQYQSIPFVKTQIRRGSRTVGRWVYEGKILIRNRDI